MYTLVILILFIMRVLAYLRFPQKLQKNRHFISLSNFATTTSDMEELVYKNLKNNCHVDKNSCLLLCVSGGIDSMCMLHMLYSIKCKSLPDLQLSVVHFNHKLRDQSDQEENFVSDWAHKYNLPIYTRELPVEDRFMVSLQARARRWRRKECLNIITQIKQQQQQQQQNNNHQLSNDNFLVGTAHHKDDQVETFYMKLLRGVHISKLNSLSPKMGYFVKPMLPLSKDQIRNYMEKNQFKWMEDDSNASRKYKRNKVRLDLIPLVEELSGGKLALYNRMNDLEAQSTELKSFFENEVDKFIEKNLAIMYMHDPLNKNNSVIKDNKIILYSLDLNLSGYFGYHSILQKEILRNFVSKAYEKYSNLFELENSNKNSIEDDLIDENLDELSSLQFSYSGTNRLHKFVDSCRFGDSVKRFNIQDRFEVVYQYNLFQIVLTSPYNFNDRKSSDIIHSETGNVTVEYNTSQMDVSFSPLDDTQFIQNTKVVEENQIYYIIFLRNIPLDSKLNVRYVQPGDVFLPPWKNSPVKITQFMRSKNIPLDYRDKVPVIALENNIIAVGEFVSKFHYIEGRNNETSDLNFMGLDSDSLSGQVTMKLKIVHKSILG